MPILDEWASGSKLTKPPTGFPDWRIQRGNDMFNNFFGPLLLGAVFGVIVMAHLTGGF